MPVVCSSPPWGMSQAEPTTPTSRKQKLSRNNLRKTQISRESCPCLANWTNIFTKNYEPNRKNYAPDCARFAKGSCTEKCLKFLATTEKAILFFCNGVVLVVMHFNSETRHCQGRLRWKLLLFFSDSNSTEIWVFFLCQKNFFADFNQWVNHLTHG